jgi:hypothetical protein
MLLLRKRDSTERLTSRYNPYATARPRHLAAVVLPTAAGIRLLVIVTLAIDVLLPLMQTFEALKSPPAVFAIAAV